MAAFIDIIESTTMRQRIRRLLIGLAGSWTIAWGITSPSASEDHAAPGIQVLSTEQILGVCWNHLIGALRSGSAKAVRAECTRPGYQSLVSRMDPHRPAHEQWRRLGQEWSSAGKVRWQSITAIAAYGRLGPRKKEQAVILVLTPQGWKLDNWSPPD